MNGHDNLLVRVRDLILETGRVGDPADFRALVADAFFGLEDDPTLNLVYTGSVTTVVTHGLWTLFNMVGGLSNGHHPFVTLLGALRVPETTEAGQQVRRLIEEIEAAHPGPRTRELRYLDRMEGQAKLDGVRYTPLEGSAAIPGPAVPEPGFEPWADFDQLFKLIAEEGRNAPHPPRTTEQIYDDIVPAVEELRRVVLLGEPGAGKTTTLWKLAAVYAQAARSDAKAPLPVLLRLGLWPDDAPLAAFMASWVGNQLADDLPLLLAGRRIVLLLDGLNEMPIDRREVKARQLRALIKEHSSLMVVASCRKLDYVGPLELDLTRMEIQPLTPRRIHSYAHLYLAKGDAKDDPSRSDADAFFWQLAGGPAVRQAAEAFQTAGISLDDFFDAPELPDAAEHRVPARARTERRTMRADARRLFLLASNPLMLRMLTAVYGKEGSLPPNRAKLLDSFVRFLITRENRTEAEQAGADRAYRPSPRGEAVLSMLQSLAWDLQQGDPGSTTNRVRVATDAEATVSRYGSEVVNDALRTNLLGIDGTYLHFGHHLFQEYFAAKDMLRQFKELRATSFWPADTWWEPTNWEEATVLLAGLYSDDCTAVLDWVQAANPLVAARCILNSGANTPRATLLRLKTTWQRRLVDPAADPNPLSRAAVGRALGMLWQEVDGHRLPLDDRPGVGLFVEPRSQRLLPDIDWVPIAGGPFHYQKGEPGACIITLRPFQIARYPVTWAQFQTFVDDADGYASADWWTNLTKRHEKASEASWPISNHPRDTIDWDEAMAFCRWLTNRLHAAGKLPVDLQVRLPLEEEWERAARGPGDEGREYPWGNGIGPGRGNFGAAWVGEDPYLLGRTSPVGCYPDGGTREGVMDLAGNIWEWCLNEYYDPACIAAGSEDARVVRGGSWNPYHRLARAVYRYRYDPSLRSYSAGFRLVVSSHTSVPLRWR